jgi:phospholipid/cholesterol/gamma-HCH transport system permease protein
MEACSGQALPIVTLISFLVGMILAFIGAIQLALFGAEIYVADLVGIAMVRLMAAIMTGIVMAGRTGGAFAAQLGTMQVNQEIDSLKTLGLSPMEFLVLPRMLALALMMPFLALYANVMGILGGAVATMTMPSVNLIQYFNQLVGAVSLWDLGIGLFSSAIFGVIVAVSGCMRGMQCGRSAAARLGRDAYDTSNSQCDGCSTFREKTPDCSLLCRKPEQIGTGMGLVPVADRWVDRELIQAAWEQYRASKS